MKVAQIVGLVLAVATSIMLGILIWAGVARAVQRGVSADVTDPLREGASTAESLDGEVDTDPLNDLDYSLTRATHPFDNLPVRSYAEGTIVVPILMYHYISDPPAGAVPSTWQLYVSSTVFDRQMRYLYLSGYNVVSLDQIVTALGGGESLPEKPVAITFDDMYQSQVSKALPILDKYDFKATFFVCTACPAVKGENVQAVIDAGHSIGSHSIHHENLTKMSGSALRSEIADSKWILENRYGVPVHFFAYPGCLYSASAEKMVANAGYAGAVTCVTPYNGQTYDNRYHLARRLIDNDYDKFIARLEDREGMW